jgi:hypothetical protein
MSAFLEFMLSAGDSLKNDFARAVIFMTMCALALLAIL